jgi:transposase
MARPYSDDLRLKLLEAHDLDKGTLAELADRFGVSVSWAWRISSVRKRTGLTERKRYQPGPKVRVDREAVRRLLELQPDLYLRELQPEVKATVGTEVSTPHLWKIVGRAWFPAEKRSLHATERDTETNRQRREVFAQRLRSIARERLIF